MAQTVKILPAMQETWVQSLGQEDPLEKGVAMHFSIFTWRISRTKEPAALQSMGSQRMGQDWATNTFFFNLCVCVCVCVCVCECAKLLWSHLIFCNLTDCSPPGLVWLLSLSIMHLRFIHVVSTSVIVSVYCWGINTLYVPIHQSISIHQLRDIYPLLCSEFTESINPFLKLFQLNFGHLQPQ